MKRVFLAAIVLAAACGDNDTVAPDPTEGLVLDEQDGRVSGTFAAPDGATVTFTSEEIGDEIIDITVRVNGMILTALHSYKDGVTELDGFTGDAIDTVMTEDDHATLAALSAALTGLGDELSLELETLRRSVSVWSGFPTTMPLRHLALAEADRSYTSICSQRWTYQPATADCDYGAAGLDVTKHDQVWINNDGDPCSGSLNNDGTAVYVPAAGTYYACDSSYGYCSSVNVNISSAGWYCFEPMHDTRLEAQYGNCYGNCGAGCEGSGTQFTVDCKNHDQCVRSGHVMVSGYCDDDFSDTIDDEYNAPNC